MKIIIHHKDANPDGTRSPDEEQRKSALYDEVARTVSNWKRQAYEIGGTFRGPGIWNEVKKQMRRD